MIIIFSDFLLFAPLPNLFSLSFWLSLLVSFFHCKDVKYSLFFLQLVLLKGKFSLLKLFQWIKHSYKADIFDKCRAFTVIVKNTRIGMLFKAKYSTYCDRTKEETKEKMFFFFLLLGSENLVLLRILIFQIYYALFLNKFSLLITVRQYKLQRV